MRVFVVCMLVCAAAARARARVHACPCIRAVPVGPEGLKGSRTQKDLNEGPCPKSSMGP